MVLKGDQICQLSEKISVGVVPALKKERMRTPSKGYTEHDCHPIVVSSYGSQNAFAHNSVN